MRAITFERKIAEKIMSIFEGDIDWSCLSCGAEITPESLGAIVKGGAICNSIFCLDEFIEDLKENQ